MKLRILALPVVAASLVLAGCSGHRNHDGNHSYDRTQMQNSTSAPEPASMPDGNTNSAGPRYPNTGGSR